MISAGNGKIVYNIEGVTTPIESGYEITFPYPDKTTVHVYLTGGGVDTEISTNSYSIENNGTGTTPYVKFADGYAFPDGQTYLTIIREVEAEQLVDLRNGDTIEAEVLEESLDKLTELVQQLNEKTTRTVVSSISDTTNLQIPTAKDRANGILGFNDDGTARVFENGATMIDDITASATAAKASEELAGTYAANAKSYMDEADSDRNTVESIKAEIEQKELSIADSVQLAKDWAIKTDDKVDGSEYSSKYYSLQSKSFRNSASTHATNASTSATEASESATKAETAKTDIEALKTSVESTIATAESSIADSVQLAKDWAIKTSGKVDDTDSSAKTYAIASKNYSTNAETSATNASNSAVEASESATKASSSATEAANSATAAAASATETSKMLETKQDAYITSTTLSASQPAVTYGGFYTQKISLSYTKLYDAFKQVAQYAHKHSTCSNYCSCDCNGYCSCDCNGYCSCDCDDCCKSED